MSAVESSQSPAARVLGSCRFLDSSHLHRSCVDDLSLQSRAADMVRNFNSARRDDGRRERQTQQRLQQRHFSPLFPKTKESETRVIKQTQLLDVLEARIQQLQSDGVLDVQHAKVQVLKAPPSGKGSPSGKGPKTMVHEKGDIGKPKQTTSQGATKSQSSKNQPSRWLAKLNQEKTNIIKKEQSLQKLRKNVKGKPQKIVRENPQKVIRENPQKVIRMKPQKVVQVKPQMVVQVKQPQMVVQVKPQKVVLEKPQKIVQEKPQKIVQEKPQKIVQEKPQNNVEKKATSAVPHKTSKEKSRERAQSQPSLNPQTLAKEKAEVEELESILNQQDRNWLSSTSPECRLGDQEEEASYLLNSRSYLEACAFSGDVQRANFFLVSQHKIVSRRKRLDIGMYNTLMRIWAKKGTLSPIGRLFILMEEAGLKPDLGSYCTALECMGRSGSGSGVVSRCFTPPPPPPRCLDHMESEKLSLDDLFSKLVFRQDERDMVMKAVHSVRPDYRPVSNDDLGATGCHPALVRDFYLQREVHHYPKLDFTREELQERFRQQLRVEQDCTVTIDSVEALVPVTEHMAKMRALLGDLRSEWRKTLLQALREMKTILSSSESNSRTHSQPIYPYLCLLDDREYVDIMMQSVAHLPLRGESLKILSMELGHSIHTKCSIRYKGEEHMVNKLATIYSGYADLLAKDGKVHNVLPREHWLRLEAAETWGPTMQSRDLQWPSIITMELGICMVDLIVKHLKISSDILKISSDILNPVGFIKPHPIFTQIQQEATETRLTFDSHVMPMLCPPVPWISAKYGACLLSPTKLMRTVDGATQHEQLLVQCPNLHPVLDSLNLLGSCTWQVNKLLLDIVISIFNSRGNEKLGVPPPLSEAPPVPNFNDPAFTSAEKALAKREAAQAKKRASEMHSLRMDALYKLSIANHMRDAKFWFPHNMDFRGRTYPCPTYFNHLGSDVTRALLSFAEGKPLGPKGLDWLKIHLVNLTGLKKRSSLVGRLEFANSVMEDILDSADHPLHGKKWWMDADEPWQALGCCMEIANAVRSPDPAQFISHLPVQQDGSCNGLQHYAALGRDTIGATSVNLMPCDVPQDVYSGVAQQVEEFRARDAKSGLKTAQILEGFINRKVVKQTVMTVVYGVTRYGGRLQIEKRLKEIEDFPKEYVWDASQYLVRQVFSGLKEMFTGTREIQDWLTDSARLISMSGHTVEWQTPLGMPVIQPYHRSRKEVLKHDMQTVTLQVSHDMKERPDTVKQKNAFPPNFIHSLDSTHMMLTSLYCYSAGLTFVSVHDCFWTHADTVDTMNKVCREQFVALHSQPILQDLSNFLLRKYCSKQPAEGNNKRYLEHLRLMLMLSKVPQTGDFNLQRVKESTYFFS
ncbi:hypothetical protein NHX12_032884 [Muraenolepis orangiensis]|uniref:DNA-directed RNA polymerase n=1 Tax=Muraenolepis orangiensis TaxID=630683 RepID=A0A9Q0E429_9TELE|nr:hypothetical protein NHX12_032884 [Muraenolepis orangiensis]